MAALYKELFSERKKATEVRGCANLDTVAACSRSNLKSVFRPATNTAAASKLIKFWPRCLVSLLEASVFLSVQQHQPT